MTKTADAIERTVRTVVQASAAAILALWIQAGSFDKLDWDAMWKVAVFSGGFTILTAVVGGSKGDTTSFLEG